MRVLFSSSIRKAIYYLLLISCLNRIINVDDIELIHTVNDQGIIELDSYYIINKITGNIKYKNPYDYLLGIFEAANDTTFSDSLPIAIIKEENINDLKINITISIPNTYKYLRYIPPNNNDAKIEKLKILGHEYDDTEDLSDKKLFTVTNLPLMIINTENSEEPYSRYLTIGSTVIIINENKIEKNETAEIRVRGHSTSGLDKKPYRIKFDKKQEVLGIEGEYKKWALLANHYDKSYLRNILAFKISKIIGLEFTPRCKPVDVILNRNYRGNYLMCDQIEVDKGRVDIEKLKKKDEDITGGYLLEIDVRAMEEEKYFQTTKGILGEIKYPDSDDITEEQEKYIKDYLNIMERNVYNGNLHYIDLNSFYKYFIMQEFAADIDSVLSSFHITKRKGDDKLYFGPVWDYDLSFDNDDRLRPTNEKPLFSFFYGGTCGTTREFIIQILKTNNTLSKIGKTFDELRDNGFDFKTLKDFIDETTDLLMESANLDFLRWFGAKIGEGKKSYLENVDVVVNYVEKRFESLDYLINNPNLFGTGLKINYFTFLLLLILL